MSGKTSVLWQLLADEQPATRLGSGAWLAKWTAPRELSLAWLTALESSWPIFCQFRRVLRNIVIHRMMESGVANDSSQPKERSDTATREDILRCYIFLLARCAARQIHWRRGFEMFQEDKVILLRSHVSGHASSTEIGASANKVSAALHPWITASYSVHGIEAGWPVIPELTFRFLVSRPGNITTEVPLPTEGNASEYLFPTLAAMRRYGECVTLDRLRTWMDWHSTAAAAGNEFSALAGETSSLSNLRRAVMLRIYAMVLERIEWLSTQASDATAIAIEPPRGPYGEHLTRVGRLMDDALERRQHTQSIAWQSSAPGLDDSLVELARSGLRKRLVSTRFVQPVSIVSSVPSIDRKEYLMTVSVSCSAQARRAEGTFIKVRIAEHELPSSVLSYDLELAVDYKPLVGETAIQSLKRIPISMESCTVAKHRNDLWATYELFVPEASCDQLPKNLDSVVCSAACQLPLQGRNALVLVLIGDSHSGAGG